MLQQVYLAHGGQMTGDEMALIGLGLAGALIIPLAAMAFIFKQKRSASEGAADDVTPPGLLGAPAQREVDADWECEGGPKHAGPIDEQSRTADSRVEPWRRR